MLLLCNLFDCAICCFRPMETISTGWQAFKTEDQSESTTDIQVDSLPLVTNENGEQVLRFYWLDAYEDQYNNAG